MFVQIQALQRENFQGVWRGGRFWPSAEARKVEVLNTEADPPPLKEEVVDSAGQKSIREVPDTSKIGRKTYNELKADGRIKILADGETDATISKASIEAAKRAAAEAGERVATLEAENADLKEQVQALGEELAAFQQAEGPKKHADDGKHAGHETKKGK